MFGCQQNLIRSSSEIQAILEYLCSEAVKLSNYGTYYARQVYFKTGKIPNRAELHKVLGAENRNQHYQAFYSDTAQQILSGVAESFKSFLGLLKGIKNGTVMQRPKLPGYRQGGMALVTFTGRSVKLKNGMLRFPYCLLVLNGYTHYAPSLILCRAYSAVRVPNVGSGADNASPVSRADTWSLLGLARWALSRAGEEDPQTLEIWGSGHRSIGFFDRARANKSGLLPRAFAYNDANPSISLNSGLELPALKT